MNLPKKGLLIIMLLISLKTESLNNIITFFFQPYPTIEKILDSNKAEKYSKKLQQPGYLYKKIVKATRVQTGPAGIMCTYLGFVSTSDLDGKITFPRKHQKAAVKVLITKSIQPVYMIAPDTINNWMINTSTEAEMYEFTLNYDNETGLYYIQASKIEVPKNRMIPLETIIIIADPKNVFIPEGATITDYSINLVLPTIYIKKQFNFSYNALYTLSIKQYFGAINKEYKQENQTIAITLNQ